MVREWVYFERQKFGEEDSFRTDDISSGSCMGKVSQDDMPKLEVARVAAESGYFAKVG